MRKPKCRHSLFFLRVSDSGPGPPYAVFLQNTPILSDAVLRAMPWAGMRCPVGAYWTIIVSIPRAHRVSVTGPSTAFPLLGAPTMCPYFRFQTVDHVSDSLPQRGIAYQPRVQPWEYPEKQTRVLKERRIAGSLGHRPRPRPPYAVFLQNTPILSDAVPRAMPWAGMRCPFRAS
jgi:hypothetical protein